MQIEVGSIVKASAGRDREKYFFVTGISNGYAMLADGKSRKLENAKRKNLKHIEPAPQFETAVGAGLKAGAQVQNSEIRRALAEYRAKLNQALKEA